MQYLIVPSDSEPFMTKWYMKENNYIPGMIVYDLYSLTYTKDGENWAEIQEDHL